MSGSPSFFKRFYLFIWKKEWASKRERAQAGGRAKGEGEADSPLSREPDVGLDPGTPGSWPERRQTLNWLSHPGAPQSFFLHFPWTHNMWGHTISAICTIPKVNSSIIVWGCTGHMHIGQWVFVRVSVKFPVRDKGWLSLYCIHKNILNNFYFFERISQQTLRLR